MPLPDPSDLATYGGKLANWGNQAVVDPSTDLDAAFWNQLVADTAGMTRLSPRCAIVFVGVAGTPTLSAFEAVWKEASPAPPTGARTGTGVYTWTFGTTITDKLGVVRSVLLTRGKGFAEGATAYHVQVSAALNVLTVRVFDMAGAATDAVGAVLVAEAR